MSIYSPEILENHNREMQRFYRHNFLVHGIEGGLFIAGMIFVNVNVILPEIIRTLAGPEWLIGASPFLMKAGYLAPAIFASFWLERQTRMKPVVLFWGVLQRVPFFFAGLILIFAGNRYTALCGWAAAMAPLVSGVLGGIGVIAWCELVAKTIPGNRRSSLMAFRNISAACCGLAASVIIRQVLKYYPGTTGYGILHLLAFVFIMLSFCILAQAREPLLPPQSAGTHISLTQFWSKLLRLMRADSQLRYFICVRLLDFSPFICLAFFSIQTLQKLDLPQTYLGTLVLLQTLGWIAGNFLGGWIGDRTGAKSLLLTGYLVQIGVCLASAFAQTEWQFQLLFVLFGFGLANNEVGMFTISTELPPAQDRIAYLTVQAFSGLLGGVILVAFSGMLTLFEIDYPTRAIIAVCAILLCCVLLFNVREPRSGRREHR